MRFAITGDTHLHSYTGPQVRVLPDGTNSRLRDILDCMAWMRDEAIERGCDAFLHAGDLFHNRRAMANEAWARAAQFLRGMNDKIPTYVLVGNHDLSASGDGTSTVQALDGLVHAVTTARVIPFDYGVKVGWLPYTEDPEVVRTETARLAKAGATVLIGHLGIGDPKLASCVPTDYEVPGTINVSDLNADRFQQVFLGHYHHAQKVAVNARYVGSPLQLSFKEAGDIKGFWIYDTETGVDFIPNPISPRYHIVEAGETKAVDASPKDFIWYRDMDAAQVETLRELNADREIPVRIDVKPVATAVAARISDTARTESEVLAEYVRAINPDMPEQERDALVALGRELRNAAGGNHG